MNTQTSVRLSQSGSQKRRLQANLRIDKDPSPKIRTYSFKCILLLMEFGPFSVKHVFSKPSWIERPGTLFHFRSSASILS